MYYVYVLFSQKFVESYVGITDNVSRRLDEHNSGKHVYTKRYTPWEMIYTEKFSSRVEARQRERYFKSAAGRRFLKKNVFEGKHWGIV